MRYARHLLIAIALLLLTTSVGFAQTSAQPTPNSATSSDPVIIQGTELALKEVKASREYIPKLEQALAAAIEVKDAYKVAMEASKGEAAALRDTVTAKNEVIALQTKLIDKQDARIAKLDKRGKGGAVKAVLLGVAGFVLRSIF